MSVFAPGFRVKCDNWCYTYYKHSEETVQLACNIPSLILIPELVRTMQKSPRSKFQMALTILTQLNHPLATALSGHLTYPDMPFKSICPDSRQTFLAWEPHFCLDCQEALTGIIQGPAGRRKYQHSHIDASISGNHIKAFVLAQHDVDIIFAGDGTSI